ncbi:30S ribosomal protein S18 [Mycoplasma sp. (ex Biomphalaria glabrata)]|uniref:30S ribosomal protein S18 n=1 Tax=Mycoplasma sp. (ex Biomphalaria glabrata) TaxID=1749074 RepID=UPI00073A9AEC|nr:30S ribosomal protein S18 [Mycoplasma sp. (ex Biomphalaria glabrata)]ALV23359.1 30S ribosomal protein S18 [Mycoplasma sp. (ex Biomphalaria glabrata)]
MLKRKSKKNSGKIIKKRDSYLKKNNITFIDYKDVDLLKKFIASNGKILPSKITSVTAKQQRLLANAIKRARLMSLLSYNKR